MITVEDLEASIEVLLFPKAYELVSTVLATDTVVQVKGRVKCDDDAVSLNASELTLPDVTSRPSGPVIISLSHARCTPAVLDQLREVLAQHPGTDRMQARLDQARPDAGCPAAQSSGPRLFAAHGRSHKALRPSRPGVMTDPAAALPANRSSSGGRLVLRIVCFAALALGMVRRPAWSGWRWWTSRRIGSTARAARRQRSGDSVSSFPVTPGSL